jgi:3-oxoacyl-[acyl-carrier-protein] synthase-3
MTEKTFIAATGRHIPTVVVPNAHFLHHEFHEPGGRLIHKPNAEILEQFEAITGIRERRYAPPGLVASDLAFMAAEDALASSGIDMETLDSIIVGHNVGDVRAGSFSPDLVPALASRVKAKLGIHNPRCSAMDLIFGCPGWVQGVIQADCMIRAGAARRVMVIGADTLSRVSDPHDRDSLIFADGAGATILEGRKGGPGDGILSHSVRSDTLHHSRMLLMGPSFKAGAYPADIFLKMEGRKLYKYALNHVAGGIKECLDRAGFHLDDVAKILLHQANLKMDEAIVDALAKLYGQERARDGLMPMTIATLGNSSVATVPTLLDLVLKGDLEGHVLRPGDLVVLASVGAGMNVNAVAYRMPG